MTLEDIEPKLLKRKIRLTDAYVHDNTLSVEEFIENLVIFYNFRYKSVYIKGSTQCPTHRRRSLGDIFKITRFYYPEVTLRQVKIKLIQLVTDRKINSSYCD